MSLLAFHPIYTSTKMCVMLFSMLMVLASIAMPAKQADLHTKDCIAQISLRNNSWVLRKFTIISYPPGNLSLIHI